MPVDSILHIVEDRVLQFRYFREHGDDTGSVTKQQICDLCGLFEKAILDAMYAWVPGGSLDEVDALADFIVRVRDVNGEFGERDVSYALLWTWYQFFPEWALRIFHRFVGGVGCWSDVKYMCGYLRENTHEHATIFRDAILDIMLQQLLDDSLLWGRTMDAYLENRRQFFGIGEKYEGENENGGWKRPRKPLLKRPCARIHLSLAAKWCPRETSKYGWVFALLVERWKQNNVGKKIQIQESSRHFRQIITRLSRELVPT